MFSNEDLEALSRGPSPDMAELAREVLAARNVKPYPAILAVARKEAGLSGIRGATSKPTNHLARRPNAAHLPEGYYQPSSIYIPTAEGIGMLGIAAGSAIVGWPLELDQEEGKIRVYYEGNLHNAINLKRFAERCTCAHGRLASRYPTVARAYVPISYLAFVGMWHPNEGVVEVSDIEALATWCGWTLPVSASELIVHI